MSDEKRENLSPEPGESATPPHGDPLMPHHHERPTGPAPDPAQDDDEKRQGDPLAR